MENEAEKLGEIPNTFFCLEAPREIYRIGKEKVLEMSNDFGLLKTPPRML